MAAARVLSTHRSFVLFSSLVGEVGSRWDNSRGSSFPWASSHARSSLSLRRFARSAWTQGSEVQVSHVISVEPGIGDISSPPERRGKAWPQNCMMTSLVPPCSSQGDSVQGVLYEKQKQVFLLVILSLG